MSICLLFIYSFLINLDFSRGFILQYIGQEFSGNLFSGIAQMVLFLSCSLTEIPTGIFSDKIGRTNSLLCGAFLASAGFCGIYISSEFWVVIVSFILIGTSYSFTSGAFEALLYEISGSKEKFILRNSWHGVLSKGAMILGLLAGGFLAEQDISKTIFYTAVSSMVSLLSLFFLKKHIKEKTKQQTTPKESFRYSDVTKLLKNKGVHTLLIILCLIEASHTPAYMFSQLISPELGFDPKMNSLFLVSLLSGGAIGAYLARFCQKIPLYKLLLSTIISLCIFLALF